MTQRFNRLTFYTHLEEVKRKVMQQGGPHAPALVALLTQLQFDIDHWTVAKRLHRSSWWSEMRGKESRE